MIKLRLGDLLVQQGLVTKEQIDVALTYQKRWGTKIGEALVALKFLSERQVCEALSRALRIPVLDISRLDPSSITLETLETIPLHTARANRIVPLSVREIRFKRRLVVASSDPTNYKALDEIQFKTSLSIIVMIAPDSDIEWFIRKYYMGEAESLPHNYVGGLKDGEETNSFIESISNVFYNHDFTNATKEHRKKTDK